MVFYKCDKCFKEFNHKYNYLSHINRKYPCIQLNLEDNIDKDLLITQLQNENIELKEENKLLERETNRIKNEIKIAEELQNEMKFIEKETNIIKDNNITLKQEIKVLENFRMGLIILICNFLQAPRFDKHQLTYHIHLLNQD